MEIIESFWLADPWWYPLLEIVGSVVSLIALIVILRTGRLLGAGGLWQGYRWLAYAAVAVMVAFIFRAWHEIRDLEGFQYDLIFELLIYLAVIFVMAASLKITRILNPRTPT